jgi:hypothetical protein
LEELKENDLANWLEKNAYIFTIGQLARFPNEFPGIYSQFKSSLAGLDRLDFFVESCKRLVGSNELFWLQVDEDEDLPMYVVNDS